jgi:primosomal protein N' (replication factor Y)
MKKHDSNNNDVFSILSKETLSVLNEARQENELTFVFTARRGLSPSVVCSDCGTIVTCKNCSAPVVLYGKDPTQGGNIFQCHICGDIRRAGEKCTHCDSWKLKMLGIGVENVAEKIKEKFPDIQIFILDSQHAKTSKQAREIISEFYDKPGSVLIGTEMALHYMREPIENILVASIDSLFSIPDFSIRERILRTLLRLRSKATKKFQINTRRAEDNLFENARQGNLADFYRNEFCDRKKYNYPPFVRLIKISVVGTPKAAEKAILDAKDFLEPYDLLVYPAFTERQKGKGHAKTRNDRENHREQEVFFQRGRHGETGRDERRAVGVHCQQFGDSSCPAPGPGRSLARSRYSAHRQERYAEREDRERGGVHQWGSS